MKKKIFRLASLCTIVLLTSCAGKTISRKTSEIPVKTIDVTFGEACNTKSYVGVAEESKSTRISCKYPGQLVSLNVRKGDYVKAGSVIAVISSQTVQTTKQIADATLRQALDGYDRISKLHDSGSIADVKMIEIETQLAKAKAAAESADKAIEECSVKAPYSGVIGEVYVDEGVELSLLQDIVKIMDISSMEIHFSVPENELQMVSKGSPVSLDIPALGMERVDAAITSKGIAASPLSHTYKCSLKTKSPVSGLMPGMVCKVYLGDSKGDAAIIPASTIRTDSQGRYVWTVKENIVHKTYVTPEGYSGQGVIIREGLSNGDKIITEGVQKVCSGMKVKIVG